MRFEIESLKFDERGLIPAIVQDVGTREVLTLAYMNAESLRRTLEEGETWFWSRSRGELWHKGETSGHVQRVVGVRLDCDRDALVVLVEPAGPACHTGARTCFHHEVEGFKSQAPSLMSQVSDDEGQAVEDEQSSLGVALERLYALVQSRRAERPENSYTTYLFNEGLDKILKKVGEEAAETIIAAKNAEAGQLVSEASDLVYHLVVLLVERHVSLKDVCRELERRSGK